MTKRSTIKSNRHIPYWLLNIVGVPFVFLATFYFMILLTFGAFTPWKSLASPPGGAAQIIDADIDNVWVETNDGSLFTLSLYCYKNEFCLQWLPIDDRGEITPFEVFPLRRGEDCDSLSRFIWPSNPLWGTVTECVLVLAHGYPDPEWGIDLYFAIMSNGSVKYWRHGNGILSSYAIVIFPFLITASFFLGTSLIYLILLINKAIKKRANTGCSGPGCALEYAPGFQAIVALREGVSPVRPAAEPIRWAA